MRHPSQANYLLIDGALRPDAMVKLYQRQEPFEIDPLYLGTRWETLYEMGPILVRPSQDSTLLSDWIVDESLRADSTLIESQAPIQLLADHLRRFINPPQSGKRTALLRFSDPLVAHFWLSSFSENADPYLGIIDCWWVAKPTQNWEPRAQSPWQGFSGGLPSQAWNDHALLAADQMSALEQVQRWRFIGRIHAWLSLRNPQLFAAMNSSEITQWLKSGLQAGLEWGLFTERGLAIWMEACADDGLAFITSQESRYHSWLIQNPAAARMPCEALIDAFDAYRHAQKEPAGDR